jgi:hypothetical protein
MAPGSGKRACRTLPQREHEPVSHSIRRTHTEVAQHVVAEAVAVRLRLLGVTDLDDGDREPPPTPTDLQDEIRAVGPTPMVEG